MAGASSASGAGTTRGERGEATRARILDAAVESIDAVGFASTTAQQIARGAGVSVGAVQHHFPAKAEILDAVLERSYESLASRFDGVEVAGLALDERISIFVDRAWGHYGSAAFRSTLAILTNAPDARAGDVHSEAALRASAKRASELWRRVFGEVEVPAARRREIRHYAFASLAGLAIANRLQPNAGAIRGQLALLKQSLRAIFAAGPDPGRADTEEQT
jgi:AcrR family transcriptional regulator